MFPTLRALKNLVSPEPPRLPHDELDHLHWDRETRTWRRHSEPQEQEAA